MLKNLVLSRKRLAHYNFVLPETYCPKFYLYYHSRKLILRVQKFLILRIEMKMIIINLHPQAPVAQKIAVGVVLRRFQGQGVEFY